jgi:hypothetical protein
MTKPFFLTSQRGREAFEAFVLPGIERAMSEGHVNRKHLHVVVLNPCVPFVEGADLPILFEYSIGKRSDWERWNGQTFDDFARAKAKLSWRTGLPSREVVLNQPHLLRPRDPRLWGSSVFGGVVSAASGAQPFFDEMFSDMTSAAMVGEARYYANQMAQNGDAPDFLPAF